MELLILRNLLSGNDVECSNADVQLLMRPDNSTEIFPAGVAEKLTGFIIGTKVKLGRGLRNSSGSPNETTVYRFSIGRATLRARRVIGLLNASYRLHDPSVLAFHFRKAVLGHPQKRQPLNQQFSPCTLYFQY